MASEFTRLGKRKRGKDRGRPHYRCVPLLALALAILGAGACAAWDYGYPEVYLRGTRGPYRGRVVDAQTKQPIAGAVVLAVWHYDTGGPIHNVSQFHDVLETVTDAQGDFAIDAPDIEGGAPAGTRFPAFTVFKPGYRYYQGWFASPEVMADRKNRPMLGTVELTRNVGKGRQARLRNFPPEPGSEVAREKIPQFLKAIAEEEEALNYER